MKSPIAVAFEAEQPTGVIRLLGVLITIRPTSSAGGNNGFIRLYLTTSLSEWVEVNASDYLDSDRDGVAAGSDALTAPALGVTAMWVKGNANIDYKGENMTNPITIPGGLLKGALIAFVERERRLARDSIHRGASEFDFDGADDLFGPFSSRVGPCS